VAEISDDDLTFSAMLAARLTTDIGHARTIVNGVRRRLEDVLTAEQRAPIIKEVHKLTVDAETLLDELQPERLQQSDDEDDDDD